MLYTPGHILFFFSFSVFLAWVYFFSLFFRLAVAKECIFKLSGFVFSLSALVFEIILASSQCWRLWDFDNMVVPFASIGLSEAYYLQEFNISGFVIRRLVTALSTQHGPFHLNFSMHRCCKWSSRLCSWPQAPSCPASLCPK